MLFEEYKEDSEAIRKQIVEFKILRDAQAVNSSLYAHFQDKITDLTELLLKRENNSGLVESLIETTQRAERAAARAQKVVGETANRWFRPAATIAVIGALLIVISLIWTPTFWFPLIGAVLLIGAIVMAQFGIDACRKAQLAAEQAQEARDQAIKERDQYFTGTIYVKAETEIEEPPAQLQNKTE